MFLVHDIDDVIDGDDPDQGPFRIDNRGFHQAILAKQKGHIFLVHIRRHDLQVGFHDGGDGYHPLCAQQF